MGLKFAVPAHIDSHLCESPEELPTALSKLTDAYNAGANRVVLSVVEQSGQPTVTVAAGGEGAPYLTAALEDTLICMHARDAMGIPHANQFRLRSDCGDDAAAAYLLQNWMQHL